MFVQLTHSSFISKLARFGYRSAVAINLCGWTYWGANLSQQNVNPRDDSYDRFRLNLIGFTVGLCAGILPALSWPISLPIICWYNRPKPISIYADLSDEYPQRSLMDD